MVAAGGGEVLVVVVDVLVDVVVVGLLVVDVTVGAVGEVVEVVDVDTAGAVVDTVPEVDTTPPPADPDEHATNPNTPNNTKRGRPARAPPPVTAIPIDSKATT